MRIVLSLYAFASVVLLVSCSRTALPSIRDAELLWKDCESLYQSFPIEASATNTPRRRLLMREIPKEAWPESVRKMRPVWVWRLEAGIRICTGPKENDPRWKGYFVQIAEDWKPPTSVFDVDQASYSETGHSRIYEFVEPSLVLSGE
jgi:hypothetical protein